MKLINIKITKLFELFDYDIPLDNEENLQIITGPNGFGKTMILNIIYSFFNKEFSFFQRLVFEEIMLVLEDELIININKNIKENEIAFQFFEKNKTIDEFICYANDFEIPKELEYKPPVAYRKDKHGHRTYKYFEILSGGSSMEIIFGFDESSRNPKVLKLFNAVVVRIIKEQRLFKIIAQIDSQSDIANGENNSRYVTDTINEHAKELQSLIEKHFKEYSSISQSLESSYLDRLIDEEKIINEIDYTSRLEKLSHKQARLLAHDLYEGKQRIRKYSANDAKALLVYLDDTERKLSVFDKLLAQLELFTTILNERRFTFKSIKIHKEKGFIFLTHNQKELKPTDLSSGEQHEVVLLYELIFRADQNTLVLIDEPEISLHVTWQKEFLSDLLRIIALQKIQVIVATHSPQIINGRWDLVYNLEKSPN